MRGKGHQSKYSLLVLFVAIFAFWWGIAVLTQNTKPNYTAPQSVSAVPSSAIPQDISGPVPVQESVSSAGVYSYTGSVPLPDSCDDLGTGISVSGQNPEHVTIILTLTKPLTSCVEAAGTGVQQPFGVSVAAPSGAKAVLDGLTVNGVIVPTTLTKVAAQ